MMHLHMHLRMHLHSRIHISRQRQDVLRMRYVPCCADLACVEKGHMGITWETVLVFVYNLKCKVKEICTACTQT